MLLFSCPKVVNNTIAKDLEDINRKVKESSLGLRRERVRLIKIKAKEITGEDIELEAADIDTDVNVEVNLNDLARTEGIVSMSGKFSQHTCHLHNFENLSNS